jgi:hypothetical protein
VVVAETLWPLAQQDEGGALVTDADRKTERRLTRRDQLGRKVRPVRRRWREIRSPDPTDQHALEQLPHRAAPTDHIQVQSGNA